MKNDLTELSSDLSSRDSTISNLKRQISELEYLKGQLNIKTNDIEQKQNIINQLNARIGGFETKFVSQNEKLSETEKLIVSKGLFLLFGMII